MTLVTITLNNSKQLLIILIIIVSIKAAAQLKQQNEVVGPLTELDVFLCSCLSSCPVDVMPGALDPSPRAMPQQPLNECLLPNASKMSTLVLATNPYVATFNGSVDFLGHSGQPVDDLLLQMKFPDEIRANDVIDNGGMDLVKENEMSDGLSALLSTLQWGHLCPTAPDSLASYPFKDEDPFIIMKAPSVYFAGNQVKY